MIRTRDFILVFTTVAFLLMAIGVTLFEKRTPSTVQSELVLAEQIVTDEPAQVQSHSTLSRSEKLQTMREKIAAFSELSIRNEMPSELLSEEATSTSDAVVAEEDKELLLCGNYRASTVAWNASQIFVEEVEGARIVFTEGQREVEVRLQTATSTAEVAVEPYKEIILQLPIRSFPAANPSCVATDVIGIANDGSLIRNAEAGLYGIFGSNTIVGYALDGFPIHGSSAEVTDSCGGVMGVAGYQYQISADRDTIINCFSAAPILF